MTPEGSHLGSAYQNPRRITDPGQSMRYFSAHETCTGYKVGQADAGAGCPRRMSVSTATWSGNSAAFCCRQVEFMKNRYLALALLTLVMTASTVLLAGQNAQKPKIELKNTPVLLKTGDGLSRQVLAICQSDDDGKIQFMLNGKELLTASRKKGENRYLLTVPAATRPEKIVISAKSGDQAVDDYSVALLPPKKWEVYLVQHAHTDIGYTQPQSEVLPRHIQYIDKVLDFCDKTDSWPDDAKFRWTCESAWVVAEYLRSRPEPQIERLKRRIREGRVEVTAMHCNMTELFDENVMYDFLKPLREINRSGIPVKMAMQNDINGIAWCLPDYFKDTGVKYLDMGMNETRSILPFKLPTGFWWESPSGQRMLALNADHYHIGNILGIGNKSIPFPEKLISYLIELESNGYSFDRVSLQFSGYYADNSPPALTACDLVRQWNADHESPKLRLATASEFFEYVESEHGDELPVYRKAWLDWWSDGAGSSSRETAEIRKTQNGKQVDEGLFSMLAMFGERLDSGLKERFDHLNESIIFFDEHTWGAGESVDHPYSENTTRQWMQKGAFAWEALKSEALLHEEALGRLQRYLVASDFPIVYVINPIAWKRSGEVQLFIDNDVLPAQSKARIIDLATMRQVPGQILHQRGDGAYWVIAVQDVPALGYKAYRIERDGGADAAGAGSRPGDMEKMENQFYRLTIDKSTGAINSLFDKEWGRELIDTDSPWKLGQLVRETVPNRDTLRPAHSTVSNVKMERGGDGQVWQSIRIAADMEGFEKGAVNAPKGLELEVRLYNTAKKVELRYTARKEITTEPQALYVTFPLALPDSRIVFETTGATLGQGEQIPGSASDWNVAQNFVSVRNKGGQIIVVSNEIPLWQFGDFNVGKYERYPKPGKPWLFSWVMNNYWMTNFRAFQEGAFSWSYQITSTNDTSNTYATRFSWGERNAFSARSFAPSGNEPVSPVMETLSMSGSDNILVVNCRPVLQAGAGTILLHLRELNGRPAEVEFASQIRDRPIRTMWEVNTLGIRVGQALTRVRMKPFEVKFVEIQFQ